MQIRNDIRWKWTDLPLNKTTIEQTEKTLNVKFPNDYVKTIMKYNGGYSSIKYFNCGNKKDLVFDSLLNLKAGEDDVSLVETYNNIKDRLPNNIVPFASDPFGNFICFNFNDKPATVCFWDHEIAFSDVDKSITRLSSSFSEFLDLLH